MKKLLSLIALWLFIPLFSNAQEWRQFGQPNDLPPATDHAYTVIDKNRPFIAYILSSQDLRVREWNGEEWIFLPDPVPGQQTENVSLIHVGNTVYVGFLNLSQSKYQIHQWNGSAWQLIGDTGLDNGYQTGTASLEASESQPGIYLSYADGAGLGQMKKWTGSAWVTFASNYTSDPYELKTASEGSKVYVGSDAGFGSELELHVSGETTGPFSLYGGAAIASSTLYYDIDVNPAAQPGVCYVTSAQIQEIQCDRTDGGSGMIAEPILNTGDDIYDVTMAYDRVDSIFVAYVAGTGETVVYHEEGGAWQPVGNPIGNSYDYPLDLEVFDPSNRPYLSSVVSGSGAPEIRAWNHHAEYGTDDGNNAVCQDVGGTVFNNITFNDADFDSLFLHPYSQSVAMLQNSNITITPTNAYNPQSSQNEFKIDVIPEPGQSGTVIVDLYVLDGLDTLIYPITVTINPAPSPSITTTNVSCFGAADGFISIDGLASSTNYNVTYTMGSVVGPSLYTSSGSGNITISGLSPGTVNNIVIEDATTGCSTTDPGVYTITEPSSNPFFIGSSVDASCFGTCDGVITLTGFSGSAPYQYSSDNGSTYQASATFNSLCANSYTVVIQDVNGCTYDSLMIVNEPLALIASYTVTDVTCNGACDGSIDVTASGGSPPFQYSGDGGSTWQASNILTGLCAGNINVVVQDGNGCITSDFVTVNEPPLLTVEAGLDQSGCDGDSFTLSGNGSGGVAPYSYVWDNGVVDGVAFTPGPGTVTYSCTVTDDNGCIALDDVDITINNNPPAFSVNTTNPSTCGGSDGSFTIVGLTPSTTYDISYDNGGTVGPNSMTSGGAGDIPINGLATGSYSNITVTNGNGCSTINAGPYNLVDPSAPSVDAGTDLNICEGKEIILQATNPDNALITWNNGVVDGAAFEVGATTTYTVTASSAGCTATDQVTITAWPLPDVAIAVTPATCNTNDGSATATITGGTPPYAIYWSNGDGTTTADELWPSMFYINVTDDNGCYVMDVATVSSTGITVNGSETHIGCHGDNTGAIDLSVSGGTPPYSYYWSNGETTEDLSNLVAGQYECQITDANGCEGSAAFIVEDSSAIVGAISSVEATCGSTDGVITAAVGGGAAPYNYQWKDEFGVDITGETAATYGTAPAGMYQLEVMDANGCTKTFFGTVTETGGPIVTVDSVVASTCSDDGMINIDVQSSQTIASINWNNGETTEDIMNIGAGSYYVNVTDNLGCIGMLHVTVPPVLPTAVPICIVSVDTSTNTNLIVWEKPLDPGISHYNLYRESSVAGMFQLVTSHPQSSTSEFTDSIAYPHMRSWRYKLTTVDTCGNESVPSPIHKTMHITRQVNGSNYNLFWDAYEGFAYTEYVVKRHTNMNGWEIIGTLPTTITAMADNPPSTEGIDYIVEITPPAICVSVDKAQDYNSSRSNNSGVIFNPPGDSTNSIVENEIIVEIYPNPSDGMFYVNLEQMDSYTLQIFDLSGKLIRSDVFTNKQYILDMTGLARGVYTLEIKSEDAQVTEKLILH